MSMMNANNSIREPFTLETGIEIDGAVHRTGTLRPATLPDTYLAASLVAVPEDVSSSTQSRIAYQMALDDAQILAQIASLGELDPPPLARLIEIIDPDDMPELRAAADRAKKKRLALKGASSTAATPRSSLSAPASV